MTEESARNSSSYSDVSTGLIIKGVDSPHSANGTEGAVGHCRGLLFHGAHSGGCSFIVTPWLRRIKVNKDSKRRSRSVKMRLGAIKDKARMRRLSIKE